MIDSLKIRTKSYAQAFSTSCWFQMAAYLGLSMQSTKEVIRDAVDRVKNGKSTEDDFSPQMNLAINYYLENKDFIDFD